MLAKCFNILIVISTLSTVLTACGFGQALPESGVLDNGSSSSAGTAPISPTPSAGTSYVASWEKSDPRRRAWSDVVRKVVEEKAPYLYKGPPDVRDFCPMYDRLGREDRLNFWVEFTAGVAKYESGWKPTSRMVETTMGIDPITKKKVQSEGLLQLSYQDVQWAPFCDFSWQNDNKLYPSLTDPRRSILDPAKNLSCGLQILNQQVQKKGAIELSSGVYWAVLKINGQYTKLKEIKAVTTKLSFCK